MANEKSTERNKTIVNNGESHHGESHPDAAHKVRRREPLPPAAQRALAEAEERRVKAAQDAHALPKELGGPKGPEPTRFGDWERKGIASDF
jgi:hypothetical protein